MAHSRITPLEGLVTCLVDLSPVRCTGLSSLCSVGAQSQYAQNLIRASLTQSYPGVTLTG